ncbi:poliovirus receptor isoform X2 [Melanotaenia boesemani]|uniref:poliovirus receptor isoform X2 n=1 Tax=Melanotaenia boesemani TaxID=1250792 RepID=UPI001C03FF3E|nr:poliovirus receptor isoform X2 [Melanotaenia boesemani]
MARHDARNWPDCTKMIGLLYFVSSILIQHGTSGQRVKVEPEVLSYPGQTVNLRCAFSDATGVQLTMITWIYEPKDGERINIAVFHPNFDPNYPESPVKGRVTFAPSPPTLSNPSIQISGVTMTDEGKYVCEYATYPDGNEQGITQLVMLAKPQNSASIVTVNTGTQPVVVARCESVDGRPAAKISWVTTAKGNATTSTTAGASNTVTVSSEYNLVPSPEDNGKDISCVVEHRTQVKPESIPLKLAIQYAPVVEIKGYDHNWYLGRTNVILICEAKANPIPTTINWKTMSGEMPDNVQINGNELKVLKVDETINTTFVCEVNNRIGTGKSQVTAMIRDVPLPGKGATTSSIIGAIIGAVILIAMIGIGITLYRRLKNDKLCGDRPPKHKPPPPQKNNSAPKQANFAHAPVTDERQRQNEYIPAPTAEQVSDLDGYHEDEGDDYDKEALKAGYYYSDSPPDQHDPSNSEHLHHNMTSDYGGYYQGPSINREDSFVSSAMIV